MNALSFAVEVNLYPGRTPALAYASAKVSAALPDNKLVHLFRLNGIAIHVDPNLDGYRLHFPRYRLASGKSQIAVLVPRMLERAIEDAVFSQLPAWQSDQEERAKVTVENAARQQEGAR